MEACWNVPFKFPCFQFRIFLVLSTTIWLYYFGYLIPDTQSTEMAVPPTGNCYHSDSWLCRLTGYEIFHVLHIFRCLWPVFSFLPSANQQGWHLTYVYGQPNERERMNDGWIKKKYSLLLCNSLWKDCCIFSLWQFHVMATHSHNTEKLKL